MSALHDALRVAVDHPTVDNLKSAAAQIVAERARHVHEGHLDWAGRSIGYRSVIESAYRAVGVPSDSQDGFQAALRYHVSNVVRDVAPAEELEAIGLSAAGARARKQKRRADAPEPRSPDPSAAYWQERAERAERRLAAIAATLMGIGQ